MTFELKSVNSFLDCARDDRSFLLNNHLLHHPATTGVEADEIDALGNIFQINRPGFITVELFGNALNPGSEQAHNWLEKCNSILNNSGIE